MRRIVGCIAGLCLVMVAVATAAAAPTRDEYVAQVTALCIKETPQRKHLTRNVVRAVKKEQWTKASHIERRINALFGRLLQEIASVSPPQGEEAVVAKWLAAQRKQLRAQRHLTRALTTGDRHRIDSALHRTTQADIRSERIISGYGLGACET